MPRTSKPARPILQAMGKNIVHAGGDGAGQTAKICNNMLSGICMIGTTEALALGVANGLDPKVLSDIMRTSSGTNFALLQMNPYPDVMEKVPSSRGYTGGFRSEFQLKDMLLAAELANQSRVVATLGTVACTGLRFTVTPATASSTIEHHGDDGSQVEIESAEMTERLARTRSVVPPSTASTTKTA